ncbi:MAG: response regulator [Ignavibacteriaceae bacterium]|nr:response regulator [Ignavibacteriaceae bacterium]
MKILIVDDKPENLYLLESLLKGSGYETISAVNGAEALGLAKKNKPDIIITDILMPVMDGYALCNECKKDSELKSIPIIFYTATYTHPKDMEFGLSLGACKFIIKPQDPEILLKDIETVLQQVNKSELPAAAPLSVDAFSLKEYNSVLIRKLEDKMVQTAENEKKLKEYISELERTLEQKRIAEEKLHKSESQLRSVWDNSFDGMRLIDDRGLIVRVNDAFCRLVEMEEADLLGNPACVFFVESDRDKVQQKLVEIMNAREIEPLIERKIHLFNGKKIWVEISNCYIDTDYGTLLLSIMRDITKKKEMVENLILAKEKAEEMNKLKSSFLANMSHELRTPLIGILGFSEILHEDTDDPEIRRLGKTIFESGKRLLSTLNSILNLSRIESGKFELKYEEINLNSLLAETVALFEEQAKAKDLFLDANIMSKVNCISCDYTLFIQVLNNLVHNAIKYTDEGGVTISVCDIPDDENYIRISVQDSGIGIKKEDFGLIWEEFRQVSEGLGRSYEGTGLGLTLTKRFIEHIHGRISFESEIGKGSVFTVEIPVRRLDN